MEFTQISKFVWINWNKIIGQGSFGSVFEGKYSLRNEESVKCAIKIISEKSHKQNMDYFQAEIAMSKRIISICKEFHQSYPHLVCPLVEVYDVFSSESGQNCCIVMEYCNNSLQSYKQMQKSKQFTSIESISIIAQIASGLDLLHRHNILHRDLKPDNILGININGQIHFKIGDYGLLEEIKQTNQIVGTVRYLAPEVIDGIKNLPNKSKEEQKQEQAQFRNQSTKSDLWALGVISHEISAGNYLFNSSKTQDIIKSISNFKNYKQIWEASKQFKSQINNNEPLTLEQKNYLSYHKYFSKISYQPLIELIDAMLQINIDQRLSAKQVYEMCQQIEMNEDFLKDSLRDMKVKEEKAEQKLKMIKDKIRNFQQTKKMQFQSFQSINNSSKEPLPIIIQRKETTNINENNMIQLKCMIENFSRNQLNAQQERVLLAAGKIEIITEINKDKEIEYSLNTIFSCEKMLFQLNQQDLLGFNKLSNMNQTSFNEFSLNFIDLFKKQKDQNINLEGIIPIEGIFLSDGKQICNLEHSSISDIDQNQQQIQSFFLSFKKNNLKCLDYEMSKYKQATKLVNNKSTSVIIQKLQIILQVAKSLQKIHQNGNFHGHLTTKSIYIKEDSTIALGYYSHEDSIVNNYKHNRFTAAFKSATLLRGNKDNSHMKNYDLWSLGVLIHYLFTLKHLFQTSHKIRDIVINTHFNYCQVWKDCQNYSLNAEAFPDSQKQKQKQMKEILGEVPNEGIANLISLLITEDTKKQIQLGSLIQQLERQLEHYSSSQHFIEGKNETFKFI